MTVVPTQSWTEERPERLHTVDSSGPRSGLDEGRVADASMVMMVDRRRVRRVAGELSRDALLELDEALRLHPGLVAL